MEEDFGKLGSFVENLSSVTEKLSSVTERLGSVTERLATVTEKLTKTQSSSRRPSTMSLTDMSQKHRDWSFL